MTSMKSRTTLPSDAVTAAALRLTSAGLLALCLGLFLPGAPARAETPRVVVEQTTSAVLAVLRNAGLSSDEKRQRIEEIVYVRVDFETLSRLVLARNWSRLSTPQQAEFTEQFKQHLSLTYGRNIDKYRNEDATIVGEREEVRGDWTVQTKVLHGGPEDFVVDYRLRQRDGQWRIIDVIVENVSMVSNFRSQFQEIIANSGPDRLLRLLREKNEKGEPLKS